MRQRHTGWFALGLACAMGVLAGGVARPAAAAPANAAQCLSNDDFLIIYRESALGPGSEILARRKGPDAAAGCVFAKAPGDYEVGVREEADYVLGLAGRYLVMDRGTGPNRKLVIWDLAARKTALTLAYDTSAPVKVEPGAVLFSAVTGPASPKTCPQWKDITKKGLTAALTVDSKVALPSLAVSRSGAPRCIAQQ